MKRYWSLLLLIITTCALAVDWDAPVTLTVRDAPLQDVLRMLAQQNGFSIVTHSDSLGTVSASFHEVPLRSALQALLSARRLDAVMEGDVFITRPESYSSPEELETLVFHLRYVDATDAKAMIDSSRTLSKKGRASVLSPSVATRFQAPSGMVQTQEVANQGLKVGERGETKSEVLMVSDQPQYLQRIEQLLKMVDRPPRQYSVEARFIETILSKDDKFGINWENILTAQGGTNSRTGWLLGSTPENAAAAASDATSTAPQSYLTFGTLSGLQFRSVLDALKKHGDSKLVSQPRIVAQDRQSSVMEAGVTYWIATRQASQGVGGITESYTYQERLIPVRLVVTPQLLADSIISVEVQPSVQEITGFQTGPDKQQLPIISTRSTVSRLVLRSSETGIIGGLMKESLIDTKSNVKFISEIPLIGNLFRSTKQEVRRTDLSIFLTITLLPEQTLPPLQVERIAASGGWYHAASQAVESIPPATTIAVAPTVIPSAPEPKATQSIVVEKKPESVQPIPTEPAKSEPKIVTTEKVIQPDPKPEKPVPPKAAPAPVKSSATTTPPVTKPDTTKKVVPVATRTIPSDTSKKVAPAKPIPVKVDTVKKLVKPDSITKSPTSAIPSMIDTLKKRVPTPLIATKSDTAKPAAPADTGFTMEDAKKTFDAWITAWRTGNIENYLASYSPEFLRNNADFSARKRELFSKNANVKIDVSDLKWTRSKDLWKLSFHQVYQSSKFNDSGTKQLTFIRIGKAVRIQQETFSADR